jgi:hypothetical protein
MSESTPTPGNKEPGGFANDSCSQTALAGKHFSYTQVTVTCRLLLVSTLWLLANNDYSMASCAPPYNTPLSQFPNIPKAWGASCGGQATSATAADTSSGVAAAPSRGPAAPAAAA